MKISNNLIFFNSIKNKKSSPEKNNTPEKSFELSNYKTSNIGRSLVSFKGDLSSPETLTIAIPEIPGPVERA